jgi:hypothetical protein
MPAEAAKAPDTHELVYQAVASLPKTSAVKGEDEVAVATLLGTVKRSDKITREALKRLVAAGRCLVTGSATNPAALYPVKVNENN